MLEKAIQEYINTNKSARQVAREFSLGKDKVTNELKKSRNEAIKIMDYLYSDCTVYLERKFSKYAHLTQNLEKC